MWQNIHNLAPKRYLLIGEKLGMSSLCVERVTTRGVLNHLRLSVSRESHRKADLHIYQI